MQNSIFEIMGQKLVDDKVFGDNAIRGVATDIINIPDTDFPDITYGYKVPVTVEMRDGSVEQKNVLFKTYKDVFEDFMNNDPEYIRRVVVL